MRRALSGSGLAQGARQATLLAAGALLIWALCVAAGLDFVLSDLFYDASSRRFPLRDAWWLAAAGHSGLRYLWMAILGALILAALAPDRRFRPWRRTAWRAAAGMALSALIVTLLKNSSAHSCPWDLARYGGGSDWFPLFGALPEHPGPGRCLPAGHAAAGFSLFALYFALHARQRAAARGALLAAWTLGLLATLVQVARGAHFVSHGLWTAWWCWTVCLALDTVFRTFSGAVARRRGG